MKQLYLLAFRGALLALLMGLNLPQIFGQTFESAYEIGSGGSNIKENLVGLGFLINTCNNNRSTNLHLTRDGEIEQSEDAFLGSCEMFQSSKNNYFDLYQKKKRNGDPDVFIDKYNHNGELIWTRNYGTSLEDIPLGIVETNTRRFGILMASASDQDSLFYLTLVHIDNKGLLLWKNRIATIHSIDQTITNDGSSTFQVDWLPRVNLFKSTLDGGFIVNNVADFNIETPASFGNRNQMVKYDQNGRVVWTHILGAPSVNSIEFNVRDVETDNNGRTFILGDIMTKQGQNLSQNLFSFGLENNGHFFLQYIEPIDLQVDGEILGRAILPTSDNGIIIVSTPTSNSNLRIYKIQGEEDHPDFGSILWDQQYPFRKPYEVIETSDNHIAITGESDQKTWVMVLDEGGELQIENFVDLEYKADLSSTVFKDDQPVEVTLTLKNAGTKPATDILVEHLFSSPVEITNIFPGGGLVDTIGIPGLNWEIEFLAPESELELTFSIAPEAPLGLTQLELFGQVLYLNEEDIDSEAGNATLFTVNEDDELLAIITIEADGIIDGAGDPYNSGWTNLLGSSNNPIFLSDPYLGNKTKNVAPGEYDESDCCQESFESTIKIYPNPADHYINIELPEMKDQSINAKIYDSAGQLVLNASFYNENETEKIRLMDVPSGLYTMILTTGDHAKLGWKKLLIQRL